MKDQILEELAKMYGIEINNVEAGKGGLYYVDLQERKVALDDVFDVEEYTASKHESVNLKKCSTYSTYSVLTSLMLDAA